MSDLVTHRGGCHCGRVKFEVDCPPRPTVLSCSCSICAPVAYLHLVVPKSRFRLLTRQEELSEYKFNTHTARHLFCSTCGVKSFYVPRSHPDGFSVNVRCLEPGTLGEYELQVFDDSQREASTAKFASLSAE